MKRAVIPTSFGRGICLPKKKPTVPSQVEEVKKPMIEQKTSVEELKRIINEKPANESLIKKLNGVKRQRRKISFIP